jgi:hypothetical protein
MIIYNVDKEKQMDTPYDRLNKLMQTDFWRFQYSKRNFIQSDDSYQIEQNLKQYVELVKRISVSRVDKQSKERFWWWAVLIIYHNSTHTSPGDQLNDLRINSALSDYVLVWLNQLSEEDLKTINIIHRISYNYGFFAWDLDLVESDDMLAILDQFIMNKREDEVCLPHVETFLKKSSSVSDIEIDFADSNGDGLRSKVYNKPLSIFLDPLESINISTLKAEIKEAIKTDQWPASVGCLSTAKLAFHIDPNKNTKRQIFEVIELQIERYRVPASENITIVDGSKVAQELLANIEKDLAKDDLNDEDRSMLNKVKKECKQTIVESNKQKRLFDVMRGTKHECRTLASRALGLYIWDRVYKGECSQSEAINELLERKLPAEYDVSSNENRKNIDDIKSILRREYRLACKCIDECEVLKLSD